MLADAAYGPEVQTKRVILDVSKPNAAGWNTLEQTVNSLDIGVLGA